MVKIRLNENGGISIKSPFSEKAVIAAAKYTLHLRPKE
jgi:hypothetical protein